MKKAIMLVIMLVVMLSGCRVICYICIGPQKLDEVQVTIKGQKADPNITPSLIEVGGALL